MYTACVSSALTLAVFAKSPVPGQVKTRLCPPLTDEQAARLCAAFVRDTVRKAQALAPVSLFHAGDRSCLQETLRGLPPVAWRPQGAGDLGARLARVPAPCLIVGTDSPRLPSVILRQALVALPDHDVILGPADDGGYYLIALRAPQPALFDGIAWSTSEVLAQTWTRASELGLTVALLPPFYDIDTPADLRRLRDDLASGQVGDCPATQSVLQELAATQLF